MSAKDGSEGTDDFWEKKLKDAERKNKRFNEWEEKRQRASSIIQDRQEKHLKMEHALMQQRRMLEVGTRMGSSMGALGGMMNFMTQMGSMKLLDYTNQKNDIPKEGKFPFTGKEREARDKQQEKLDGSLLGKLDKTITRAFGGNSKWNKAFGGHGKMAAGGLAMAAVGAGAGIAKGAIDSSPLMQQMLKLSKFGTMLILKPIGDFFGMVMRPVMLMLLRKFIIPSYQTWQPMAMRMGRDVGKVLTGIVELVALAQDPLAPVKDAINKTLGVPDGSTWWDNTVMPWFNSVFDNDKDPWDDPNFSVQIAPQTAFAETDDGIAIKKGWGALADLFAKFDNPDIISNWNKVETLFKSMGTDVTDSLTGSWNTLDKFFGDAKSDITDDLNGYWSKLTGFFSGLGSDTKNDSWVNKRWDTFTQFFSSLQSDTKEDSWVQKRWNTFTSFIVDGLGSVWTTLGQAWGNFVGFIYGLGNIFNPNEAASGFDGMVNRPTLFMAGEAGSEHVKVTPKGQQSSSGGGAITVNVNIDNMSGDSNDLNKLRSTILEVMQTVNVNRGR